MSVKYLLEQKGRNVWTIDPGATVLEAVAKMAENDVGSLVVMDDEKLVGIITERHYSRNIILKGKTSPTTLVRDIMERDVIHVRPEQSVEHVAGGLSKVRSTSALFTCAARNPAIVRTTSSWMVKTSFSSRS